MIGSWVLSAVVRFSSNGEVVMRKLAENSRRLAEEQKRVENQVKAVQVAEEKLAVRANATQNTLLKNQKNMSLEQQKMALRTQTVNQALSQSTDRIANAQERLRITARSAGNESIAFQQRLNLEREKSRLADASARASYERSLGIIDRRTAAERRWERAQMMSAIRTQSINDRAEDWARKAAIRRQKEELQDKAIEQRRVIGIRRFEQQQISLNITEQRMANRRDVDNKKFENDLKNQALRARELQLREERLRDTEARRLAVLNDMRKKMREDAILDRERSITTYGFTAGAAGVGAMADAMTQASNLQVTLRGIANVTAANQKQLDALYQTSFDLGNKYALSPVEVAKMFKEVSRQAQGQMSFQGMMSLLPYATQLQAVLGPMRGMSPEQTVDTSMSLMHLFRKYNVQNMTPFFDTFARLMELTPATPTQLMRQFTYVEPLLKGLNVPDEQAATIMLMMTRAGYASGKGASGLANLVQEALGSLQLTGHAQAGKKKLLERWGILNKDGSSPFFQMGATDEKKTSNLFAFLRKIAEIGKTDPHAIRDIFGVFGKQGGRIGALFADPVMVKAFEDLAKAMTTQKSLGLSAQADSIMNTLQGQFGRSVNNLQAVMTELGYPWLNDLTNFFRGLADSLHGIQAWLHAHRESEKMIGALFSGITGLILGRATLGAFILGLRGLRTALDVTAVNAGKNALAVEVAAARTGIAAKGLTGIFTALDAALTGGLIGGFWKFLTRFGTWISGFMMRIEGFAVLAARITAGATSMEGALALLALPISEVAAALVIFGAVAQQVAKRLPPLPKDWQKFIGGDKNQPGWLTLDMNPNSPHGKVKQTDIHIHGDIHLPNVTDAHGFVSGLKGLNLLGTGTSSMLPNHLVLPITAHSH